MDEAALVAGIDKYSHGWVAVVLRAGQFDRALVAPSLAPLVAQLADARVIGLDMPIGLPEREYRPADLQARDFVGPRRASVFLTPPRAVLEALDYATARERSLALSNRSVSRQAFGLHKTILEADVIARRDPRIREVHPEVSFRALADEPFPEPKSSWAGAVHRRLALERAGIVLPEKLGDAGWAGVADILDAAAAAWSAHQIASGVERSFPPEPSVGADGHVAAIWY